MSVEIGHMDCKNELQIVREFFLSWLLGTLLFMLCIQHIFHP